MNGVTGDQLPPGWTWTQLQTVVEILDGARIPVNAKDRATRIGGVPYYGATGQVGWIDDYLFDETLVLLGEDGAPFFDKTREVAYVISGPSWVNNHAHVLRAADGIASKLLAHQLNVVDYHSFVSGTTRWKLNQAPMRRIPVRIPPVAEQTHIADAVDELFSDLDAGVAALERVQEKLKLYRASVLKAAVEGALTAEWRIQYLHIEPASELLKRILAERRRRWEEDQLRKFKEKGQEPPKNWKAKYKEPVEPDTSELPPLPEGWCWGTVSQLAGPESNAITDGPFGSELKTEHYSRTGPRVIRLQNIKDGVFSDEHAHITEERFAHLKKHHVSAGDLVIAALGDNPPRACVVPDWLGPAIVKADCIRFKPHGSLLPHCINYLLNAAPTRLRTKKLVHGVGRPRMNLDEIRSIVLPIPPAAEQEAIVEAVEEQLSVIGHLEAEVEANLKSAQILRQAILHHAFTGQLVPQDPNDEPASELLKRITAEREARARETDAAKRANKRGNGSHAVRSRHPKKKNTENDGAVRIH